MEEKEKKNLNYPYDDLRAFRRDDLPNKPFGGGRRRRLDQRLRVIFAGQKLFARVEIAFRMVRTLDASEARFRGRRFQTQIAHGAGSLLVAGPAFDHTDLHALAAGNGTLWGIEGLNNFVL